MNSFIPWVGGKGKLLWIINKLMPDRYTRFIDVFGGSGTVTMCRPIQRGCMEVYNDFNGNLTNLFCCVKNRPMALLAELGFLPLNTRDDFNVLYKFFSKGEFTDDYLQEEMDLTEVYLKPPDAEAIRALMLERAPRGSIRRAADFFKLIRYSFSGGAKSFGGKPYVWGTYGNVLTESLLTYKVSQYPDGIGNHEDIIRANWLGGRTADCVGLIKGYGWLSPETMTIDYGTHGMPDIGANQMYYNATESGAIDTMPDIPGLAVWHDGHIGVYIGNGQVVEAMGTKYGVVKTELAGRGWTHWLKVPYIRYD